MFLRRTCAFLSLTSLLTLHRTPTVSANSFFPTTNFSIQDTFQHMLFEPLESFSGFRSFSSSNMTRRAPAIAISHGGGPLPILSDPGHAEITKSLKTRVPEILKLGTPEQPKAIVLVTAHWSERNPTISNSEKHSLYYDYYGFPRETYSLKYDAPGSPKVAEEVHKVLEEAGLKPEFDEERGWDHGVFVPMLLINPKANIPIVQMSVLDSENPADHYKMGQALSSLRDQNIAIIGSGFASFHNLRLIFSGMAQNPSFKTRNEQWSKDVAEGLMVADVEERKKRLGGWRGWTGAYEMHPRGGAEHFLPLVVVAGAGGEGNGKSYSDAYMGLKMWTYYWED